MEFDDFSKIAKDKGIKIGLLSKGLYKIVAQTLPDDENILDVAEGLDKKSGNKSPVIVTDKNVYLFKYTNALGGIDQSVIPIKKVTSMSSGGAVLLPRLIINDGTKEYVVEKVGPKAKEIIKTINDCQASASSVNQNSSSNTEELRELKKLLDDGIISQDDFDKKKKQILGL